MNRQDRSDLGLLLLFLIVGLHLAQHLWLRRDEPVIVSMEVVMEYDPNEGLGGGQVYRSWLFSEPNDPNRIV